MPHKLLNEAPEYIRNFVASVSISMTKETETHICKIITEGTEYFKKQYAYIHFIIRHCTSAKINSEIYKILKDYYPTIEHHKKAFDYWLQYAIIDKEFIIGILENSPISPDIKSINALLSRSTKLEDKLFYEILDIFLLYELKITKEIVIKLLEHKYKINSMEKYGIIVDEDIFFKCSQMNYYPYELQVIPTDKILHAEFAKFNNLPMVKKLKELGGKINTCCLEIACTIPRNFKIFKYLINELGIKPNNSCIQNYVKQKVNYETQELDILLKNYTNVKVDTPKPVQKLTLDKNSTLTVEPNEIIVNKEAEYKLKNKIKKFLNYNKMTIKYMDLYELILKYLVSKNLIIDSYFIINNELSNLLKINECSILHIDQIDNILTYFIT